MNGIFYYFLDGKTAWGVVRHVFTFLAVSAHARVRSIIFVFSTKRLERSKPVSVWNEVFSVFVYVATFALSSHTSINIIQVV